MKYLKRSTIVSSLILCSVLISACMSVKFGSPLVTDGLDALEIGESTRADVLLALGQPRGNGSVRLSQDPHPRDIVYYELVQSDGKNVELEILLVFMLEGTYDGYLWFASSERIRMEGGGLIVGPGSVELGYFPDVEPLESLFVRGKTTRDEVREALSLPTGIGAAILPPQYKEQAVMYYEDIEVGDIDSAGGEFVASVRNRILLVLLTNDVYDGFMWASNQGVEEARAH